MYQAENEIYQPSFQYGKKSCLGYSGSLFKRERLSPSLSFPELYCLEWGYWVDCGMEASYGRAKILEEAWIPHHFMEIMNCPRFSVSGLLYTFKPILSWVFVSISQT